MDWCQSKSYWCVAKETALAQNIRTFHSVKFVWILYFSSLTGNAVGISVTGLCTQSNGELTLWEKHEALA